MNQKKRPIGITLLAIFAGFAALFAVVHTLQLLHFLPIPGPFGVVKFFAFDPLGALMWGILAAIYIWVARMLWSVDARGWLFVVIVALFNLVIIVADLIGGSTWQSLLPSILVNGLILIYCFLPGTKEAFIPQEAPKAAAPASPQPVRETETAVAAPVAAATIVATTDKPEPVVEELVIEELVVEEVVTETSEVEVVEETKIVAAVVENVDIEMETAVAAAAIVTATDEAEPVVEEVVIEELVVEEVVTETSEVEVVEETEIVAAVVENVDIEMETAVVAATVVTGKEVIVEEEEEEIVEEIDEVIDEIIDEIIVIEETEETAPTAADIVEEAAHASPGENAKLATAAEFIEGIGPAYSKKLQEVGIDSPKSLLEAGATPKGRKEIEEATGISHKLIMKWLNAADLYRVKGIGTQYAELLVTAGVNTVLELANRNPENLHQKLVEVNEEKHHVREVPSLNMVTSWVEKAKELPRVISY